MSDANENSHNLLFYKKLYFALLLFTSAVLTPMTAAAVEPSADTFVLGMDVNGYRINLYQGCGQGNVSCDDMLIEAPDLSLLATHLQSTPANQRSPYRVKYYQTQTIHSTCSDGISPCRFHGYGFEDDKVSGFIDPSIHTISLRPARTNAAPASPKYSELTYTEQETYLPLLVDSELVDAKYEKSDKDLNESYQTTKYEVDRIYGARSADELKQDQINWIKQRSKDCGADNRHRPRTQAEKVCFIQKNNVRMSEYFLWID